MKKHETDLENIIFTRHRNFGGVLIGYHDNSDADTSDMNWAAKGVLCFLNLKNYYSTFTEIYSRTDAVVRDHCVFFDGKKVFIAISGESRGTGYKIYETDISDPLHPGEPKQLITGPGNGLPTVADFEPCYLPNDDILFSSTRNFGFVAENANPTTNMFFSTDDDFRHQIEKCIRVPSSFLKN